MGYGSVEIVGRSVSDEGGLARLVDLRHLELEVDRGLFERHQLLARKAAGRQGVERMRWAFSGVWNFGALTSATARAR